VKNEILLRADGFLTSPWYPATSLPATKRKRKSSEKKLSQEVQGPGFFVINAGNSAEDF
jgi:hypothetical protein